MVVTQTIGAPAQAAGSLAREPQAAWWEPLYRVRTGGWDVQQGSQGTAGWVRQLHGEWHADRRKALHMLIVQLHDTFRLLPK